MNFLWRIGAPDLQRVSATCYAAGNAAEKNPAFDANFILLEAEVNRAIQRFETENPGVIVSALDVEPPSDEPMELAISNFLGSVGERIESLHQQSKLSDDGSGHQLFAALAEFLEEKGIIDHLKTVAREQKLRDADSGPSIH
jgi:hypothetical protein